MALIETAFPLVAPPPASLRPPLIRAQNVHRLLGSGETAAHILRGVSLEIRAGEYVSIVGASGSGKSTFLYLLGGLDRPSELSRALNLAGSAPRTVCPETPATLAIADHAAMFENAGTVRGADPTRIAHDPADLRNLVGSAPRTVTLEGAGPLDRVRSAMLQGAGAVRGTDPTRIAQGPADLPNLVGSAPRTIALEAGMVRGADPAVMLENGGTVRGADPTRIAQCPPDLPSRIFIDGEDTTRLNDAELASLRNAKVGFVFQFHYLLKEFTAQENVCLPMFKLGRLSRVAAMERGASLLTQLGLASKIRRRANNLSGGEQQRVAIARALANEPAVLLADEPTGNLDRRNSELVADIFHTLADGGQTIVMVTHDQTLAHKARRIVTMEDGKVIRDEETTRGSG